MHKISGGVVRKGVDVYSSHKADNWLGLPVELPSSKKPTFIGH